MCGEREVAVAGRLFALGSFVGVMVKELLADIQLDPLGGEQCAVGMMKVKLKRSSAALTSSVTSYLQ
jgi:hypothetical protein